MSFCGSDLNENAKKVFDILELIISCLSFLCSFLLFFQMISQVKKARLNVNQTPKSELAKRVLSLSVGLLIFYLTTIFRLSTDIENNPIVCRVNSGFQMFGMVSQLLWIPAVSIYTFGYLANKFELNFPFISVVLWTISTTVPLSLIFWLKSDFVCSNKDVFVSPKYEQSYNIVFVVCIFLSVVTSLVFYLLSRERRKLVSGRKKVIMASKVKRINLSFFLCWSLFAVRAIFSLSGCNNKYLINVMSFLFLSLGILMLWSWSAKKVYRTCSGIFCMRREEPFEEILLPVN